MGPKCCRTVLINLSSMCMEQPQKLPAFTWHQREKRTNPQHLFRMLWFKMSGVTTLKVQNEQRTLPTSIILCT